LRALSNERRSVSEEVHEDEGEEEPFTQIIDGEEVDVPPPGWTPSAGSKYRGVSQQKNEYRAYVTVPSRGMISAGTHATEYAAAKAVAVLSRELQHELPYTIPEGLVTIPKWVVLTYECPHCKTLMHSDPSDGFCPRFAAHVRECRKGGRYHLESSGNNTSTSAGQSAPDGSANIGEPPGRAEMAGFPPAKGCAECCWSEAGCVQCSQCRKRIRECRKGGKVHPAHNATNTSTDEGLGSATKKASASVALRFLSA
jgi:hypothetical protein